MLDVMTWADDLYPIVLKRFQDRIDDKLSKVKSLIGHETLKTSNQFAEEGIGGYGYLSKYNGSMIPEMHQKRGYKKTYTPEERVGKASIHYKYAKIDQSGEAKRAGQKMANSINITIIRDFYNLFANGWNPTVVGGDGVSLFSASHKVNSVDSDVFSNTGTTAFSVAGITATETAMQRYKTYDGADFDLNTDLCLIAPELAPKARELFGKDAVLIPETAGMNGANPVADYRYVVIKGFTAKQWALCDSTLLKDYMKMIEITAPMVIPNKPDNPLVQEYVGYCDYDFGWSDSRMIFGHNPA